MYEVTMTPRCHVSTFDSMFEGFLKNKTEIFQDNISQPHISRPKKQRCQNHAPIFQDNISPKAKGKDDSNHNVIT